MPYKDPKKRREYLHEWRLQNYERLNAKNRARHQEYQHHISIEDWDMMWDLQNGCCYLCGGSMERTGPRTGSRRQRAVIDHHHSCCPPGESCARCRRGLTHHLCNTLIGAAGDEPVLLHRIADALEIANKAAEQRMAGIEQLTLW